MDDAFTKAKGMTFPRQVRVGHDVLADAGDIPHDLGLSGPATVVTGPRTRKVAGDEVARIVEEAGFEVGLVEVDGATPERVDEVVEAAADRGFLLGVGGGSVIDVAKYAAHQLDRSFLSVPTAASHDGLTSPRASIKEEDGSSSKEATAPLGIVADTGVIVDAPYEMLASGCADALSNLTAVKDWELAHRLRNEETSSFAIALSRTAAEAILDHADSIRPNLEEAAWVVVKSLIVSGVSMSVAGSSRPASGAEHMFSHTLDELAPGAAHHGEQVGVGAITMMYLHGGDWEAARDALASVGAPTTADELGIDRETIVEALVHAHENKPDRYTILGEGGLTREAAEELVTVTGVA
jgi:glycerol-1-phosphate dehydrogenase [NAD(P)+]